MEDINDKPMMNDKTVVYDKTEKMKNNEKNYKQNEIQISK